MMRFAFLLLSAILSTAAASSVPQPVMFAKSSGGVRRRLEEDADYSWMSGFTVKYQQCFQDQYGNNLVYFSLCPAESKCESGCEGGMEYVADLLTFVDAFTEAQMGAHEYACETAREACEENGQDDDAVCYANAGLNNCGDGDDEDEFNVQEWLECAEWENANENDNDENEYFVGPYCYQGQIHLEYFLDDACTQIAQSGTFENNNGYSLEYSIAGGIPVIDGDCANCKEHGADQDQNDGDQEDEDDVLEQCEELFEASRDWTNVAEQYDGQVTDVRATPRRTKAQIAWIGIGVFLGLLSIGGCCYYGMMNKEKSNVDKTNLI